MQNPFFVMSLSGSAAFLIYKLLYTITKQHFYPRWKYIFLKIVLGFYVIPIPWLLNDLRITVLNRLPPPDHIDSGFFRQSIAIITDNRSFAMSTYLWVQFGATVLAVVVELIMIGWTICEYTHGKTEYQKNRLEEGVRKYTPFVYDSKKQIPIYVSQDIGSPFVIGITKSVVLIPESMQNELENGDENALLCIRHELAHIQSGDLAFRFLAEIALCFHWFNPFCHWFREEFVIIGEICCDNKALENATKDQIKNYFNTLISRSGAIKSGHKDRFFARFLGIGQNEIKRRIQEASYMKTPKKKWLAVLSSIMIIASGTVSAMAYEPPHRIKAFPGESAVETMSHDLQVCEIDDKDEFFEPLPFDHFYTDEFGNVYELNSAGQERASCNHTYKSVRVTNHAKKSDGGCIMKYYNAQICTKCQYITNIVPINEVTFKKCPH